MNTVLKEVDAIATQLYKEVVVLASLFNEARERKEIDPSLMFPTSRLIVAVFARVLGPAFAAREGTVINLTRNSTCQYGSSAEVNFDSKTIARVRTWEVEHAWLCINTKSNILIDVLPPGADPQYLSPIKYLPNICRPWYEEKKLISKVNIADVNELSSFLDSLLRQNNVHCSTE